jgi:hypothetical protein
MKRQAILFLLAASSSLAQGTFQNLNFESARNIPTFDPSGHPWTMSAADALPGWSCYLGTNNTAGVWYNDIAIGSAVIGIQSGTSPYVPAGLLGDEYCLSLQGGLVYASFPSVHYQGVSSIAQTGQLPADARSIRFKTSGFLVSLSFAGVDIPLAVLTSQTNYSVLGGDISQFAGQMGELRFKSSAYAFPPSYLDDIEFSPVPIPEPSPLTLFAFGSVLLIWRSRGFVRHD